MCLLLYGCGVLGGKIQSHANLVSNACWVSTYRLLFINFLHHHHKEEERTISIQKAAVPNDMQDISMRLMILSIFL